MKRALYLAVAGLTVLLLTQCATKEELREVNYQVRAVNQKVDEVRSSTVDQMQKRQASSVSRLDQIQEEVVQLRARLDESTHQEILFREQAKQDTASISEMMATVQNENSKKIQMLEEKINQLERSMERISNDRIREAEERARLAARRAEEARMRTVVAATASGDFVKLHPEGRKVRLDANKKIEAAPSIGTGSGAVDSGPAVSVPVAGTSGGGVMDEAMELFRNKNYTEAYKRFERVLSLAPTQEKAAEALFFMGESLYGRGEYDLAILDYQKVISNHAKHRRTPTALLRQGMSFEKLTDLETAKIIYKKLIAEYPNTTEADTAQKQLVNLQ